MKTSSLTINMVACCRLATYLHNQGMLPHEAFETIKCAVDRRGNSLRTCFNHTLSFWRGLKMIKF